MILSSSSKLRIHALPLLLLSSFTTSLFGAIGDPWVNEFHYDDNGSDANEFVEIIVPPTFAGSLTTLRFTLYNGGDQLADNSYFIDPDFTLDATLPSGHLVYSRAIAGIQNGAPDGFSLDDNGTLIEFLSYEGTFTAADGPANGVLSTDVGVSEPGTAPELSSIQRQGSGSEITDFTTWVYSPGSNTQGAGNSGQTVGGPLAEPTNQATVLSAVATNNIINLTWTDAVAGAQAPTGYLLKAKLSPFTGADDPADNTDPTTDSDLSDGTAVIKVAHPSTPTQATFTGLVPFTQYYFKLWSYTNSGTDIDFKLDGTPPTNDDTTANIPSVPKLIISEIMRNPAGSISNDIYGEWFEIYNATSAGVDIQNYIIKDDGGDTHTITSSLIIPSNDFVVIGSNTTTATNGGITSVEYTYDPDADPATGSPDIAITNTEDELILEDTSGNIVDRVAYDDADGWPDNAGQSMVFTGGPNDDNNDVTHWATATARESRYDGTNSDFGSPGTKGTGPSQAALTLAKPELTIWAVTSNQLGENADTIDLRIVLDTPSVGTTTFNITETDPDNRIVNLPATLQFLNTEQFKTLTVTGLDNGLADGNYTVNIALADQGPTYDGDNIDLTVIDDEALPAGTIIYTQYYEDSPGAGIFNKYLEISNTSGTAVNLNGWTSAIFSGSNSENWKTDASPPSYTYTFANVTVPAGGSILIANEDAITPAYAIAAADITGGSSTWYSGDDSVVLYNASGAAVANIVDAISVVGEQLDDLSLHRVSTSPGYDLVAGTSTLLDFDDVWERIDCSAVDAAPAPPSQPHDLKYLSHWQAPPYTPASYKSKNISLSIDNPTITEGDASPAATITVTLSSAPSGGFPITLDLKSTDNSEIEFVPAGPTGTLTMNATVDTFPINAVTDGIYDLAELVYVIVEGQGAADDEYSKGIIDVTVNNNDPFASQLVISQVIESNSGSTPRGIEVWNVSGNTIDFSATPLRIAKYSNGATNPSFDPDIEVTTGTLCHGEVMVIGSTDLDTYIDGQGLTDVLFALWPFPINGDDAIKLYLNNILQDTFGDNGGDPGTGWSGSGVQTNDQNIALTAATAATKIGSENWWTDPSLRFETITTDNTPTGFGVAPAGIFEAITLTATTTAFNEDAGAGVSTVTVTVPTNVGSDTLVNLVNPDPSEITIPATVTILNGTNSIDFNVDAVDDGIPDGDAVVSINATIPDYIKGKLDLTVLNVQVNNIFISQYYYDGSNKFVELGNKSASPVALTGWKLVMWQDSAAENWKTAGNTSIWETDLTGQSVPANGTLVIAAGTSAAPAYALPPGLPYLSDPGFSTFFGGGNDTIALYFGTPNNPDNIADVISVTNAGAEANSQITIVRKTDGTGHDTTAGSTYQNYPGVWDWTSYSTANVDAAAGGVNEHLGTWLFSPAQTFANWIVGQGATDTTASGDEDNDGAINMLEYAYSTATTPVDPTTNDATFLIPWGTVNGSSQLVVNVVRADNFPADISFTIEASDDLSTWTDITGSVTTTNDGPNGYAPGASTYQYTNPTAIGGANSRFMRIVVEEN